MNGSGNENAGFTPHVMHQLHEMSASANESSRGSSSRRRGRHQYRAWDQGQLGSFQREQANVAGYGSSQTQRRFTAQETRDQAPDLASFPSLGAARLPDQTNAKVSQAHSEMLNQQPAIHTVRSPSTHPNTQRVHVRGRGGHFRAGRSRGSADIHHAPRGQEYQIEANEFQRPQASQQWLYAPGGNPYFGTAEQQRAFRHRVMAQSDFLSAISNQAHKIQITQTEYEAKELFRHAIQKIAQKAILDNSAHIPTFDVESVKLMVYGSLGSGFGIAGSDMDLLLVFPKHEDFLGDIEIESRRWLERALLDAGHGARLLTNTRVPILKVCECPPPELLKNLREYRQQWEESVVQEKKDANLPKPIAPLPPLATSSPDIMQELAKDLEIAIEIPLPEEPPNDQTRLDFVGECGIQCDVNFTNYVALRNTELLRTYGNLDGRVRHVGLFVKHWAKSRDINTPYKGTLSSYGYIMMVLHYLMNVANPPILPNLQLIARNRDAWEQRKEIETIDNFDVRFIRDPEHLRHIVGSMTPNHESVGSLLRGFFWYYACNGGYHWTRDTISIRSPGGLVTKQSKGWTGAKWSESKQNVRLRYLLAIEDPFETDHNIGRTVGHSGIVAIRDEFRRAWSIIDTVQFDGVQKTWYWTEDGVVKTEEMFTESIQNRGDLLRKDQQAHREKMRQMKREAEAREKALQDTRSEIGEITDGTQRLET